MIAPGNPARGLQLIDARDVSAFVLDQVEARAGGIHNVVPDGPNITMGQLIDNCVRATGSDAVPVWMDENFLLSQGVQPWAELPLWIPDVPDTAGFGRVRRLRESGRTAPPPVRRLGPGHLAVAAARRRGPGRTRHPATRPRQRQRTAGAGRLGLPAARTRRPGDRLNCTLNPGFRS